MQRSDVLRWLVIAVIAIPGAWLAYSITSAPPPPPTIEAYLAAAGPGARRIEARAFAIEGVGAACGSRPTVLDPALDDVAAAHPGYIIVNPKVMDRVPKVVRLYAYAHECGHQLHGVSETAADCYAAFRGQAQGWLTARGIEEICAFWRPHVGDATHLPGPERCALMQRCFAKAGAAQ
jgi:hypothetical protein